MSTEPLINVYLANNQSRLHVLISYYHPKSFDDVLNMGCIKFNWSILIFRCDGTLYYVIYI